MLVEVKDLGVVVVQGVETKDKKHVLVVGFVLDLKVAKHLSTNALENTVSQTKGMDRSLSE